MLTTAETEIAAAGLKLIQDAVVTGKYVGASFQVTLPAGELHTQFIATDIYAAPSAIFQYNREHGARHGGSTPEIGISVDWPTAKALKVHVNFGLSSQNLPVADEAFEVMRCERPSPKGLRREILYSGAAKGILTLEYREYAGDLARPAFSQQATFDLSQGDEIGFKGSRIKILKTSNLGLEYVVLKPFDR